MDDNTLQALTALAQKLNTTAEHLWGVLVRQAPISGATDLFIIVLVIASAIVWSWFMKNKTANWDEDSIGSVKAVSIAVYFCFGGWVMSRLPKIVSAFLNPEYWALKQIIN